MILNLSIIRAESVTLSFSELFQTHGIYQCTSPNHDIFIINQGGDLIYFNLKTNRIQPLLETSNYKSLKYYRLPAGSKIQIEVN